MCIKWLNIWHNSILLNSALVQAINPEPAACLSGVQVRVLLVFCFIHLGGQLIAYQSGRGWLVGGLWMLKEGRFLLISQFLSLLSVNIDLVIIWKDNLHPS